MILQSRVIQSTVSPFCSYSDAVGSTEKRERKNKSARGEGRRGECRREGGGIEERKEGWKGGRKEGRGERDKSGPQLMFVP